MSSTTSRSLVFIKDDSMPSPMQIKRHQDDNQGLKSISYSSDFDDEKKNNPMERFDEQITSSAFQEMNGLSMFFFSFFFRTSI